MLPVVKEHKYLGVLISYGNALDRTLGLRIQAANHAFIRLRAWWKPSLPLKARMDLWFQLCGIKKRKKVSLVSRLWSFGNGELLVAVQFILRVRGILLFLSG